MIARCWPNFTVQRIHFVAIFIWLVMDLGAENIDISPIRSHSWSRQHAVHYIHASFPSPIADMSEWEKLGASLKNTIYFWNVVILQGRKSLHRFF
ncbi:hypothetical protein HK14_01400 [Acetobacter cibinongensis]|uniref:Uncharacterized protein n=1 Tax=Acetobacter cibinongensis TaxID=146475 RepID=A0A1Z5YWR5_9PROT|nr:hypothetical protein HK14_01400 [Acetobacter cibinongensis]